MARRARRHLPEFRRGDALSAAPVVDGRRRQFPQSAPVSADVVLRSGGHVFPVDPDVADAAAPRGRAGGGLRGFPLHLRRRDPDPALVFRRRRDAAALRRSDVWERVVLPGDRRRVRPGECGILLGRRSGLGSRDPAADARVGALQPPRAPAPQLAELLNL